MEQTYVQLKNAEDLIRLVSSLSTPFLQQITLEGKCVYFIQALTLGGPPLIYYTECNEKAPKKYATYNRYRDEVSYSDQLGTDPQTTYIPIIEVKRTNLFSKYPP
ncbi:MAG: hypothetical protein ABIH76_05745 [Candidatus Bathyarchaeota archaeon]